MGKTPPKPGHDGDASPTPPAAGRPTVPAPTPPAAGRPTVPAPTPPAAGRPDAAAATPPAAGRPDAAAATLPAPRLEDIRVEDLKDTGRLFDLLGQAIARGWVGTSEADRLRFVAAAEHALAIGQGNPPGLFAYLVRNRCWRYITQGDEDRAQARIKAYLRGPSRPGPLASAFAMGPALSADAGMVRDFRAAFAAAGYYRDPFPEVMRRDPRWTRERWEAAMAELGF